MEPFGPNNLKPIFCSRNCVTTSQTRTVGNDNKHLQLFIKSKNKIYKGIAFGRGDLLNKINESKGFDILYSVEKNTWNGNTELQLIIMDLKLNN